MSNQSIDPILARNFRQFERDLKKLAKETERNTGEVLWHYAPVFASKLVRYTQPSKPNRTALEMGTNRTRSDVRRVYLTLGSVYEEIEKQDEQLAKACWHAYKKGDISRLKHLLGKTTGRPALAQLMKWDGGDYHRRSRNRRGRISNKWQGNIVVGDTDKIEAYVKKKVGLVGYAKAGWISGLSKKARGVPLWVKRNKRGQGRVIDRAKHGVTRSIDFVNTVPHIEKIFWKAGAEIGINGIARAVKRDLTKHQAKIAKKI